MLNASEKGSADGDAHQGWRDMTLDEAHEKIAQAYQVIGVLALGDGADVSDAEATRALDYFADIERFDEKFLPWPKDGEGE